MAAKRWRVIYKPVYKSGKFRYNRRRKNIKEGEPAGMKKSLNKSKKRLVFVMAVMFILCTGLCFRAGWIQIVRGEEYSRMAVQQQIRDVTIPAKRGMNYDAKKKELAVSTDC